MRRSGILLVVIVVLILALSVAAYFVISGGGGLFGGEAQATEAPPLSTIVIMAQPVSRDDLIPAAALVEIPYPEEQISASMFRKIRDVADIYYAKYPLEQGIPLTKELISERPGVLQGGSDVARTIDAGKTAITLPISRLGAVGYAIRDGDRVNVIVTTNFVDLDSTFQSLTPNYTAMVLGTGFLPEQLPILSMSINSGGSASAQGRAELDPTLNQAMYLVPSETQRPRLISQMILQDIQVLHVGQFNLTGDQTAAPTVPEGETPPPTPIPDIVTLIVSPQEAVSLTYLLYSQVKFTLTLRSPDDPNFPLVEAVTLQHLLSQYNISPPAKLPYGLNPRIDVLTEPSVPASATVQ